MCAKCVRYVVFEKHDRKMQRITSVIIELFVAVNTGALRWIGHMEEMEEKI